MMSYYRGIKQTACLQRALGGYMITEGPSMLSAYIGLKMFAYRGLWHDVCFERALAGALLIEDSGVLSAYRGL